MLPELLLRCVVYAATGGTLLCLLSWLEGHTHDIHGRIAAGLLAIVFLSAALYVL